MTTTPAATAGQSHFLPEIRSDDTVAGNAEYSPDGASSSGPRVHISSISIRTSPIACHRAFGSFFRHRPSKRDVGDARHQAFHAGVSRPRELTNDASLYRALNTSVRRSVSANVVGRSVAWSSSRTSRPSTSDVQYKPLYEAIGEPNDRHRKPASLGRLVERLMLLDAVPADTGHTRLGTEQDKLAHFIPGLLRTRLQKDEYPLIFGETDSIQSMSSSSSATTSPARRPKRARRRSTARSRRPVAIFRSHPRKICSTSPGAMMQSIFSPAARRQDT